MFANAIAQVEPPAVGIHLIWMGPHVWVYSPRGWAIQRREYVRRDDRVLCDALDAAALTQLRAERERPSPLGTFTLRAGLWPLSAGPAPAAGTVPCEVVTLELAVPRRLAQITVTAKQWFALALREGKVVAVDGPRSGSVALELRGVAIDTVIVYEMALSSLRVCVDLPTVDEERDWGNAPFIVKNLQLPLRELVPALDTPSKEFAEGKARLLAGESLDEDEFARLTRSLRSGVQQAGPPRPIDQVLLMREEPTADFEELGALDPIRVLLSHPKWRRVLGFGWFDGDPALEPGKTYEYRITGAFPAEDIQDKVYGFHTIPSQTLLPAEFLLHDLRLRVPEPVTVQRAPGTPDSGLVRISRRGIPLRPRQNPWWTQIPPLDDNSLVVDFPSSVTGVVVELHATHQITWTAHGFGGLTLGPNPMPPGERPRLSFPFPVRQMRLRGTGFLHAIRVPAGPEGLQPLSLVLPPVLLQDTPRPQPPVSAAIHNLQQPAPIPTANDIPGATAPRRPALGFEVNWRPALRDGLAFWPPDADAAPPLDAAVFQIEHREEAPAPAMFPDVLIPGAPARAIRARPAAPRLDAEVLRAIATAPMAEARRGSLIRALAAGDTTAVHELVLGAASDWTAVLPDENTTLGDRSSSSGPTLRVRIHPGTDLMLVFPEIPRRGNGESLDLTWADVFDFAEGGHAIRRPVPAPGTFHRYRVRTLDPIGRPSLTWTETNLLRLEKHVPPPLPVGPDQTPAELFTLPRPSGVQARVIVKDGPGLTSDDLALLGSDDNVVVLRWGWHAEQREQDAFATQFRCYRTGKPLEAVSGIVTAVNAIGLGVYEVTVQLERPVVADAAKDAPLEAGYPFVVYAHSGGQTITATVGTRVADAQGNLREPALGPVELYTHLTPNLTRPPAWTERFEVQPITAATEYRAVIRNRLTLTPDHPRDSIWVGVSAADDQSYVADQLEPAESRAGNESAIVAIMCEARYQGRPDFSIPPPLDPVPVLLTAEPTASAIEFALDLTPYLGGTGLTSGDLIRPEHASAAAVFTAYRATVDDRVMAKAIDPRSAAETDREVIVPNPGDRSAIVAALNGPSVEALEDRFVVFLAGSHPYADRLFEPVTRQAIPLGAFRESLPPLGERYVYRLRRGDGAGHLSAGGAMATVVVRVPSMTTGPVPTPAPRRAADPPGMLRIRVSADPTVTHLLTFHQVTPNGSRPGGEAVITRVPNLRDAYPAGIRARAPNGTLLVPDAKPLSDSDVEVDAEGVRTVGVQFSAGPAERVLVWACSLTRDGVPSILAGPFGLVMPPAPLPVPTLAAAQVATQVVFAWTWPAGDHAALEVALERSLDGVSWHRFSPLFGGATSSYVSTPPGAGPLQYRVVVVNAAGRKAFGDPITPV